MCTWQGNLCGYICYVDAYVWHGCVQCTWDAYTDGVCAQCTRCIYTCVSTMCMCVYTCVWYMCGVNTVCIHVHGVCKRWCVCGYVVCIACIQVCGMRSSRVYMYLVCVGAQGTYTLVWGCEGIQGAYTCVCWGPEVQGGPQSPQGPLRAV